MAVMDLDMERLRRLVEAGDSPAGYMTPAMALYLLDRLERAEAELERLDPPSLRALVAEVDALRHRVADGDESARGELLAALDALDAAQAEVDRARGQRALQSIGCAYETLLGELDRVTRERDEALALRDSFEADMRTAWSDRDAAEAARHAAHGTIYALETERHDALLAAESAALVDTILDRAGVPKECDGCDLDVVSRVSGVLRERRALRRAFGEAWAEVERLRVGMAKSNEMAGNIIMDLVTMLREATGRDAALDDLCRAAAAAWREAAGGRIR